MPYTLSEFLAQNPDANFWIAFLFFVFVIALAIAWSLGDDFGRRMAAEENASIDARFGELKDILRTAIEAGKESYSKQTGLLESIDFDVKAIATESDINIILSPIVQMMKALPADAAKIAFAQLQDEMKKVNVPRKSLPPVKRKSRRR